MDTKGRQASRSCAGAPAHWKVPVPWKASSFHSPKYDRLSGHTSVPRPQRMSSFQSPCSFRAQYVLHLQGRLCAYVYPRRILKGRITWYFWPLLKE
jgi:hypothetical protein